MTVKLSTLVAAGTALAACATAASPEQGTPPASPPPFSEQAVAEAARARVPPGFRRYSPEELAQEQGIPLEEARRRRRVEDGLAYVAERLASREPATFAGYYGVGDARVAMFFTRDAEATLRRYTADPELIAAVDLRRVRWSLRELEAAKTDVTTRLKAIGLEPHGDIDLGSNVAVVYVRNRAELRRVSEAKVPIPENVRLLPLAFEEQP